MAPDRFAMERIAPPAPTYSKDAPTQATEADRTALRQSLQTLRTGKTIAEAASLYSGYCKGGDVYQNNCAHFLSDAFILAGADDLASSHSCIEARCDTSSKRPIRARNMKCWFESRAVKTSDSIVKEAGYWAVFQLDENAYWGGHVAIIDSDSWKFFGTGWYENWKQYWYQW